MYILSYMFIIWLTRYMKESQAVVVQDTSRNVCSGDSIQLFRNVTIDNIDMVVSLYIQASDKRILAMWTLNNATISDGYSTKIFLDKIGDMWIRNVSPSDEAQYILRTVKRKIAIEYNVTLRVQAAPTINCKPTITRVDDVLVASLNSNECGKPLVSVDWLDYPGIQNKGNEFMLPKTNKYGIYYACISGPAVKCAQTSKLSDYCSAYDGHDDSSKPGIQSSEPSHVVVLLVSIVLVLVLVIFGMLVFFLRTYKNGTLCGNRKRTEYLETNGYTKVSTATELTDVRPTPEKIS